MYEVQHHARMNSNLPRAEHVNLESCNMQHVTYITYHHLPHIATYFEMLITNWRGIECPTQSWLKCVLTPTGYRAFDSKLWSQCSALSMDAAGSPYYWESHLIRVLQFRASCANSRNPVVTYYRDVTPEARASSEMLQIQRCQHSTAEVPDAWTLYLGFLA